MENATQRLYTLYPADFDSAEHEQNFLPHIPPEKIMPRHINRWQFVRNATALAGAGLWLTSQSERANQWNMMAKKE
jgi:hypothetical protein